MKRRDFFQNLFAFGPLILGFFGITGMSGRYLTPKRRNKFRKVFATSFADLGVNESMPFQDLSGKEFIIIRTGEKEVKALSTTCTHLGCTVKWQKDKNRFYCPCHEGIFDPDGNVISGPPPRKLDTYETEIIGNNVYLHLKEKDV